MGAAPGHTTSATPRTPAFLPIPPQKAKDLEPATKPYQVGKASWYGGLFQGKATASGEDYDMYRLHRRASRTAAGHVREGNKSEEPESL